MDLTTVGLGTWSAGGGGGRAFALGPQQDSDSIATLRAAVEAGVNWFDTAPLYGLGHSEEVLGEALSVFSDADRPFVFTKCGRAADPLDTSKPPFSKLDAASIRAELETSLRRLRVERIDLYQVHAPNADGHGVEDYWSTLLSLRDEGKVAHIGLSNHTVAQLEIAEGLGHVESLQPPLSAIKDEAVIDLLPWCRAHHCGVIAYSPMGGGILAGSFTRERAENLPPQDWRRTNPAYTTDLDRSLRLADAVRRIAAEHGVPMPAVAVAWVLAQPGVTGAIVGARRPDQLDGWLQAASVELTAEDQAAIKAAGVR
jgi:aryl-alcohol dehydrogenase-like predicted oxidoreductase